MENNKIEKKTININEFKNEINEINNNIIEITNLIDKKSLEISDENENNNKKILHYKLLMENIILEHHKICKELYKNY